jgi:hypothetical protein
VLSWWRTITVVIASVLAGRLFAQLIAREKKELMLTVPHAAMLSLLILAAVGLGDEMFEAAHATDAISVQSKNLGQRGSVQDVSGVLKS